MAVDQNTEAEFDMCAGNQPAKRRMVRLVNRIDAPERILDRYAAGVDFHIFRNDARNGAEAAGNPQRIDIGIRRQHAVEHARIELIWLAVDVDIGAGKIGEQQRRSENTRRGKQLVDVMIFRAADGDALQAGLGDKIGGIDAATMGRAVDKGNCLRDGLQYLKNLEITHFCGHQRLYHVNNLSQHPCCQLLARKSILT